MPKSVMGSGTPPSTTTTASVSIDKNRRRQIKGPIDVLRGHQRDILCCCVNSDLGIVVSCFQSSDVLLHSIRQGRLIRRLVGSQADIGALSSEGVVLTWNKYLHSINTFTVNGVPIAIALLPFSDTVSCIQVSLDGKSAVIGLNASANDGTLNDSGNLSFKASAVEDLGLQSKETKISILDVHCPSVCLLDIHKLEVFHVMKLGEGQDVTALALSKDNTNLLVSTVDRQLIVFTDPSLSLKVVDHMLKLGWEGDGLSPLIKT